jgi:hypothetical protein
MPSHKLCFAFECGRSPQDLAKEKLAAAEHMPGQRVGKDPAMTEPE